MVDDAGCASADGGTSQSAFLIKAVSSVDIQLCAIYYVEQTQDMGRRIERASQWILKLQGIGLTSI
jgi:hypothetical protein